MEEVILKGINKIYDNNVQAVFDFNLVIKDHEFIVFVGPSGCGKSTTLRMIAGLEDISSGELYIDGRLSNDVTPKDRDIAMVFQSYALYPHMTVYDNMAFGLKIRHLPKADIDRRVHEAARILEIEQYLDRKPKALSGGQRQRVALGRAIVRHAKVFLMDEPLSNLDAKLRVQMRSELIRLHEMLHATTIYVTHDQTEAMTMATRIVVMKAGYIQQIGAPIEIYNHPDNLFVASFIGSPAMNLIDVTYAGGKVKFADGHELKLLPEMVEKMKSYEGQEVVFGIRPEDIHQEIGPAGEKIPDNVAIVEIKVAELLGHEYILHFDIAGTDVVSKVPAVKILAIGDKAEFLFNMRKVHLFDKKTTLRII
jgi:multiple sugar transport system ATP-binding protein